MEQAYAKVGVDQETFNTMDPEERCQLITRAYAMMYTSDPDSMKWAGMAAYAADKIGFGMGMAGPAAAMAGADGGELKQSLADGNAAVFEDIYWQHLAFQQGGVEALQEACDAGDLPPEQLERWRQLADAKIELARARELGDEDLGAQARDQIWAANGGLLRYEQDITLQGPIYDQHRELFKRMSPLMDSPVPGAAPFRGDDIGDLDQRWDWITSDMLPAWQRLDADDPERVARDMEEMSRLPELPPGGPPVWNLQD
jgi:hypothetical protein